MNESSSMLQQWMSILSKQVFAFMFGILKNFSKLHPFKASKAWGIIHNLIIHCGMFSFPQSDWHPEEKKVWIVSFLFWSFHGIYTGPFHTQSCLGPAYMQVSYSQPTYMLQQFFWHKLNGETWIKIFKTNHKWMQDGFKGYFVILGIFEWSNLANGKVFLFFFTPCTLKSSGNNGESKNYFINIENVKFFQNLILFCLM